MVVQGELGQGRRWQRQGVSFPNTVRKREGGRKKGGREEKGEGGRKRKKRASTTGKRRLSTFLYLINGTAGQIARRPFQNIRQCRTCCSH